MRRLTTLAWGLLLVVLDLRINGFDLLPDPLGWVIGAVAASSLARSADGVHPGAGPWFRAAAVACVVAVLPAVPDWFGVEDPMITVAVRWADLGLPMAFVALLGGAVPLPELGLLALVTGLASLAVFVWFLVLLIQAGRDDAAAPQAV